MFPFFPLAEMPVKLGGEVLEEAARYFSIAEQATYGVSVSCISRTGRKSETTRIRLVVLAFSHTNLEKGMPPSNQRDPRMSDTELATLPTLKTNAYPSASCPFGIERAMRSRSATNATVAPIPLRVSIIRAAPAER